VENGTRRRWTALAAISGGALVVAVIGQGVLLLDMGKELRGMRGRPTVGPPAAAAIPGPALLGGVADPASVIAEMQREMDRAFAEPFADPLAASAAPGIELTDSGREYVVRVDVPGGDGGKVDVKVDGRTLTVDGTFEERSRAGGAVASAERRSFSQTVELPGPVDAAKLRATRDGGVLTIVVPKTANG
jgi:HSP20 family molecular chaperone IbpA